ncbi:MAG: hypothetical protein A2499_16255 [Stygiobacter sp. RIFOXYC12_FULL_38_8]|nr:MAG: hypothetical protein A2299_03625 [Stygiobacter sp. RIFOXYB2_FULL_37_11]OGV10721.1 MAG: hypothetical protein A2237_10430 [Stygiobacter sp. RIFOXYA2_FULL_38_8]OGV12449.1 MAG: hypothetical protein A2440_14430 [Stygiobacter sp. RIFOXYC2_FULL_38_25]OGV24078.1 MAG: hypothetical protein A2499_16255 [Stygiobacter sp. RIFOXYC12_FULL_38_8]OGV78712.1 MAG: hypothetical protein A2X65_08595 [Stygiobacter sp. GWF2_38_21]
MHKKWFLLFILVSVINAQNKVDSLVTAIHSKPVTEQINILNDFCWKYRDIDPRLAVLAAEISMSLSEKIGDIHLQAKALNYQSVIYRDQGAYEKSLAFSTRSLQLAQSVSDQTQIAYSYNNISTIYRLMGNYSAALEKLYRALEIFESIKDKVGIGYCYYNLGFVYMRQENFDKALENFETTVKIRESLNDAEGKTKALGRIAEIYLRKGENQKALTIFREVEKAYSNFDDQRSLISIRMGLAELYKRNNDLKKALYERKHALELSEKFADVIGIVTNASEMGVIYALAGNISEGKKFLEYGASTAKKYNSSELKLTNYKSYAEFFEIRKDYTNAYKYAKLLKQYQDSIYKKEKSTAISEVEAAYQLNKKEREKELVQKDLEKNQQLIKYWTLISVLFVGLSIVAILLYFLKRRTTVKLRELNATKDKFFSIIAHDLKNPITAQFTLTSMIIENYKDMGKDELLELIEAVDKAGKQTYRLLENLLYWSRAQIGRLEYDPKEIFLDEMIRESYDLLFDNAKAKNITLVPVAQSSFAAYGDEEMIKTVLRNLISNAIKFTNQGGTVRVELEKKKEQRIVRVIDNGVGIPPEYLDQIFRIDVVASTPGTEGERGTGLGLILCKEFVEKNGGKLRVESEEGKGSTFSFSLPVKPTHRIGM